MLAPVSAIAESFGEMRGFGVVIQVGEGELDLSVNEKFSLCIFTGPHCQVKSQSSQPLLMFAPRPAGFLQASVSTWPVALFLHDLLSCL